MAARHSRVLARVAELSLALAEDAQASALATSDVAEKKDLVAAFDRAAGRVCRAVAIEAKLERDERRDAREAKAEASTDAAARVETRKRQVRADVERRIFTELDAREGETWLADLDERLEEEALFDGFTDEALEAHIERLCTGLGLTGEVRRNYIPRACRARGGYVSSIDYARFFGRYDDPPEDDEPGDEDEEIATADEPAVFPISTPSGGGERSEGGQLAPRAGRGERREGPQGLLADGGSDKVDPPDPPPAEPSPLPPAEDPEPPIAAAPEPPPQPPDPPYLPPWERAPPAGRRHHQPPSGPDGWMGS